MIFLISILMLISRLLKKKLILPIRKQRIVNQYILELF